MKVIFIGGGMSGPLSPVMWSSNVYIYMILRIGPIPTKITGSERNLKKKKKM